MDSHLKTKPLGRVLSFLSRVVADVSVTAPSSWRRLHPTTAVNHSSFCAASAFTVTTGCELENSSEERERERENNRSMLLKGGSEINKHVLQKLHNKNETD